MNKLARLSTIQRQQIEKQVRAYERQTHQETVSVPFGRGKLDILVHPLVANPKIMNSGVEVVRHLLKNPDLVRGKAVADMGTGSGIIGIAAAKLGAASVLMADIDERAVRNAIENIRLHGLAGVCRAFQSDLFGKFDPGRKSEVQIFNHPFFSDEPMEGKEWTRMMLGGTGLLGRFFEQAWGYSTEDALYLLPWLVLAGKENRIDNDPGKRAPAHGYAVARITELEPGEMGKQQSAFRIYELRKQ